MSFKQKDFGVLNVFKEIHENAFGSGRCSLNGWMKRDADYIVTKHEAIPTSNELNTTHQK